MYPIVSNGEHGTIRSDTIEGIGGEIAEVARTPRVRATEAVETAREDGFEALRELPIRDLLDRIADAGRRFEGIGPSGSLEPAEDYAERVTRATGLPIGWVTVANHWLGYALRHAAESLRAQSPTGDLAVYDDPAYRRETTVGLAFSPAIRSLGAVMPANDPTVYGWAALALAMKIPIVLRPSEREPFTAIRLARALLAAGVPESSVHVLPGPRSIGDAVLRDCDHGMLFGRESATAAHADDAAVETYGPGRSVAVVGRNPTDRELASLARGVTRTGGRACFNLSRIVALPGCDADGLATSLGERVLTATDGPPTAMATDVPAFVDVDRARRANDGANEAGDDATAVHRDGGKLATHADHARIAPTIVRSDSLVPELPFQFAGVTDVPTDDPGEVVDSLEGAYLAVAVGAPAVEAELVRSPAISKVYAGRYPAAVDLRETHETFLADFCYRVTTYDGA